MKKYLFLIFVFVVSDAHCETLNINWMVDGSTYAQTTCTLGGDLILPTAPTKTGYTFRGWTQYTFLEYIESNGTQYIDTGIINVETGSTVEVTYQLSTNNADWQAIYGNSNGGSNWFSFTINGAQQKHSYIYGTWYDISGVVDANKHTIRQESNKFYMDGVLLYTTPYVDFVNYSEMHLFNRYDGYYMSGRIYSAKIYNNGVLMFDGVPARNNGDNTIGMLDKVSGEFFRNSGTGVFIGGPEL